MSVFDEPCPENLYLGEHADLLISSYQHWTGKELVRQGSTAVDRYHAMYLAPYGVVSHDTQADPVFNYGNQTALRLFDMDWSAFTRLPSRKSAEPVNRAERDRLMQRVTREGYIDDYRGVRISSTGERFMLEDATVWNIIDNQGVYHGQAAVFFRWTKL